MNKKGFTLIELLAVIGLLAVIIVFAVPNLVKLFSDNKNSLSSIQKNQLKSSVEMYINDYCTEPISENYNCGFTTSVNSTTKIIQVIKGKTITLNKLVEAGYFSDDIVTRNCTGNIGIDDNGKVDLSNITCNFNN